MTDPISDMLSRIRNAQMARNAFVEMPSSKMKYAIAKILETEGFVGNVEHATKGNRTNIRIELKYVGKQPHIQSIQRISKPGRRIYAKAEDLKPVRSGTGFSIVSTSNGLMTSVEAKKRRLGGELICEIF